ncbi:GGDEF/EAL domain-containing sensory box protein [Legionella steelei]|uniref:GGDEF/EAL domain-containing sensory box protein n=1 Tax=Legionella steelei TaxID=947033 RepID=A0A0W0ZFK2_9GAMM|nr:GGDEF domain-containing protein [Legionella steelei]KTD67799.1 GGDEF/EAL domain-containing sensory box protein [Legionella steelei]
MEQHARQYRLIYYVSLELIVISAVIICLYSLMKLWYMVVLFSGGFSIVIINLWILSRTANTFFCGHLITLITFTIIIVASCMIWGIGTIHTQWFYVIPLLAAALVGRSGLIIYSALSLFMILGSGKLSLPPFYHLPQYKLEMIEWVNHLFAYLILVTTLINLIYEHEQYEQKLTNKNYLLQSEKDKYHYLARFDQLTNLPNSMYFKQHLNEIINSLASNYRATIFFIDLDNFKYVNDCYGHNIGDRLLLEVSRRLQISFREGDFIARIGGDEFIAVVLHTEDEKIPQLIAQRIIQEAEEKIQFENIELSCPLSIGLATYPTDAQEVTELLIKADQAMYAAKKIKGSSYCKADTLAL